MNTNKAVKLAFPKLKPQTRQIIADWYDNEDASDDFDNLRDYAEHIKFDLMDMIWAATDATEVKAVKDDLVACGYYNADQFPEDEESEDVAVPDPEDDEKKAIRIAKREGLTPKQIELFVQMRRAWANIKESTKITLTLAQLKKLVKEGTAPAVDPVAAIEEDLSDILDKIDAWRTDGSMEHWQYAQLFDLADDALAKLDEVKKPDAVNEDASKAATRKMSYADVESLIDNFKVKEKEMIHSFEFEGDVPHVDSASLESGTFAIDEEKLKLALENPKLRIFVFSAKDNGDYRLIGADSFDEYADLTHVNIEEEMKSAKIEWDSPIGRTRNPDYGIYIRRLR